MPSLGALITARRKALSLTYDGLADRSGGALSKQRWQQLGTDTRVNEFPEPRTLQLIADTIGVGVDRVILATAVTLGVDIPTQRSTFATLLPPNADDLTEEQRDAVIAVIRAMQPTKADAADAEIHALRPDIAGDTPPAITDAARTAPDHYKLGQSEQGVADGEEPQDREGSE
jgi:transcriptional regulator with XRE-family HTH domain